MPSVTGPKKGYYYKTVTTTLRADSCGGVAIIRSTLLGNYGLQVSRNLLHQITGQRLLKAEM